MKKLIVLAMGLVVCGMRAEDKKEKDIEKELAWTMQNIYRFDDLQKKSLEYFVEFVKDKRHEGVDASGVETESITNNLSKLEQESLQGAIQTWARQIIQNQAKDLLNKKNGNAMTEDGMRTLGNLTTASYSSILWHLSHEMNNPKSVVLNEEGRKSLGVAILNWMGKKKEDFEKQLAILHEKKNQPRE